MKELREIVEAFNDAEHAGKQTALVTVVHVDGSSYRRSGARMLVTEDGRMTGAISGGCLEGDALKKARSAMVQQKPMLVTYDTTDDDDAKLGIGLGCNGVITILIEPLNSNLKFNPIIFFKSFLRKREPAILITVVNMKNKHGRQYGTCLLLEKDGSTSGSLPGGAIGGAILTEAENVLTHGGCITKNYYYEDDYTFFIEFLQPAISLIVVGAGNDAIPLVKIANILGWEITVIDGRANYATKERFPLACQVTVSRPKEVLAKISTDNRTVFMLMTHNYNYDLALLAELLPLNFSYIGLLGPKKRLICMLEEISELSGKPSNNKGQIFGPAGLDIGSENPDEIALSIVSEIQSLLSKRDGLSLRTKEFIHDRVENKLKQMISN